MQILHRRAHLRTALGVLAYTVVGAGFTAVNVALYVYESAFRSADTMTLLARVEGVGWFIIYDGVPLYMASDGGTPPASGWTSLDAGNDPAPTIT